VTSCEIIRIVTGVFGSSPLARTRERGWGRGFLCLLTSGRYRRALAAWLTALWLFVPCVALGEADMLVGTVVEMSESGREVLLSPHPAGTSAPPPDEARPLLRIRLMAGSGPGGSELAPHCLAVDRIIRVWGRRDATRPDLFWATRVRGAGPGGDVDPTGVRSRLGRGCPLPSGEYGVDGAGAPGFGRGLGGYGHGGGHGGGGGGGGGRR